MTTADGQKYAFDRLVIPTGATPLNIPIPGAGLDGVFELRTLTDSIALRERLAPGGPLVVIGGGYIGLEVAATARQLGHCVSVVERLPRLMARVTSPQVSEFFLQLHRSSGIDVRLNESVDEIIADHVVTGVKLGS